jgi:cytochrome P450
MHSSPPLASYSSLHAKLKPDMDLAYPLQSPDFIAGDPFPAFRELRRHSPVHWHPDPGFWALCKYDDIRFVSSNPAKFSSVLGVSIPEPGVDLTMPDSLIFTDPPRHRQLRKLVARGFTPRQVALLELEVRAIVTEVLESVVKGAVIDFAEEVAAPLPTRMIARLIGAPVEDWPQFRKWSDALVGSADPDMALGAAEAGAHLHAYFSQLIAERRHQRKDDLLSQLTEADIDGDELSDEDLYRFCWLLLIAGNETTRNLIALGAWALANHPEQRQLLLDDPARIPGAVEEMLRWTTPVANMARTAIEPVAIRGQRIEEGDVVVMFYGSANRDEDIFGLDAEAFRVLRSPNPHLAFGFSEHICIGASLARLEARVMFEELLLRYPDMQMAGEVTRVRSTMVPGVKKMPVVLGDVL